MNPESDTVKQCSVMFINPIHDTTAHPAAMRSMGFRVHEVNDWPDDEAAVRESHVVVVQVRDIGTAPMLAARLRAKPHLDKRLLIAMVPAGTPPSARRAAEASGFDDVVNDCCDTRHLTTRILRGLRSRPGLRCVLPPAPGQSAA